MHFLQSRQHFLRFRRQLMRLRLNDVADKLSVVLKRRILQILLDKFIRQGNDFRSDKREFRSSFGFQCHGFRRFFLVGRVGSVGRQLQAGVAAGSHQPFIVALESSKAGGKCLHTFPKSTLILLHFGNILGKSGKLVFPGFVIGKQVMQVPGQFLRNFMAHPALGLFLHHPFISFLLVLSNYSTHTAHPAIFWAHHSDFHLHRQVLVYCQSLT